MFRFSATFALFFALCGLLPGPANANTEELALATAGADTLTTAAALSAGFVESNPLGSVGALVMKGLAIGYVRAQPEHEQPRLYNLFSSFWSGAAVNNLCWIGGGGPFCFLLGTAAGGWLWSTGESERANASAAKPAHPPAPLALSE